MVSNDLDSLINSLERALTMFREWRVPPHDWCLLDGPAIKLHDHEFDCSAWRNHVNVYVKEYALPWRTTESEETIPPQGSTELQHLLALARDQIHIHLVPANRYYRAGFDRRSVELPSGRHVDAATLMGCSQVWSYKSLEMIANAAAFEGDIERLVAERLVRLRAALRGARTLDLQERLARLEEGYLHLQAGRIDGSQMCFRLVAGDSWPP